MEEDIQFEEEEIAANQSNSAVVEKIHPRIMDKIRQDQQKMRERPESIRPQPQVQTQPKVSDPRFVAFRQPSREGVFDTYSNQVFSENLMEILAYLCSELDEIKRSL
jgi:hypothetical protein